MVGQGIVPENILMACQFLVSRCSCEIKEQNPGLDLLFDYPWQDSLDVSLVDMVELPLPIVQSAAEPDRVGTVSEAVPAVAGGSPTLLRNLLIAGGALVVGTLLALLIMLKRAGGRCR
jgi:hypothetical protein